jgi:hypothetical protein
MQSDQWRPHACLRMVRDISGYRARVRPYSDPPEASSDSEHIHMLLQDFLVSHFGGVGIAWLPLSRILVCISMS